MPAYMAPEIFVKSRRLKSASFQDLKQVDVWAFGIVMFNLINPDLKYPFQLDFEDGASATDQMEELMRHQERPSGSHKYEKSRETIWHPVTELHKKCTDFDPARRPTALQLQGEFHSLLCIVELLMLKNQGQRN